MKLGTVYLIPIPIADGANHTLSKEVYEVTGLIKNYFVEDIRTARRFLKSMHPDLVIESISFSEIDKHSGANTSLFSEWIKSGVELGIMSEAGCPGIADPGSDLVGIAHHLGAKVIPLVGPSSIFLALMASGFNGQNFCFHGYLPVKEPERTKSVKALEATSIKEKQTQIFIETPYRNQNLFALILKSCSGKTKLCIAANITDKESFIKTMTIDAWKTQKFELGKTPTVFLISG